MQLFTWLRWRNAMVKSDCSRSKGLTPYTCLCYRCCALEKVTTRTQRGQAIYTSVRLASTEDCISGNETRTQNACVSVPIRIASYSYTVIVQRTVLYECYVKLHWSPQVSICWIHCIENFFTVQDFWGTCACPEKQSVPWIRYIEYIYF